LANGTSALENLNTALQLAQDGIIDAITFGPFNKAALIEAGLGHEDELHYMAEFLGVEGYISELNTLDGIWTSRVSSHIALSEVPDYVNEERITKAVHLIDNVLKRSGLSRPRLSVAALNPHAGDNGNFGTEEIDVIQPTVDKLRKGQVNVDGPWPSDTVFLKAKAGDVDGIITMYHDQGQIALKLMGFDRGVTVQGGIPFPVTTPAHGTAFDIAGAGKADVKAMQAAFSIACNMVSNWQAS
jgi:4-hydroxythreonine-4-phosphate dehydrogenase